MRISNILISALFCLTLSTLNIDSAVARSGDKDRCAGMDVGSIFSKLDDVENGVKEFLNDAGAIQFTACDDWNKGRSRELQGDLNSLLAQSISLYAVAGQALLLGCITQQDYDDFLKRWNAMEESMEDFQEKINNQNFFCDTPKSPPADIGINPIDIINDILNPPVKEDRVI